MSSHHSFDRRGISVARSRSLGSVAQGPRDAIFAAALRARRASFINIRKAADKRLPVKPADAKQAATMVLDEETGMLTTSNRGGEISVLPTLEESRAHGEEFRCSASAVTEGKFVENERVPGQEGQLATRTSSAISRIFPSGSRVREQTPTDSGNTDSQQRQESKSVEDDDYKDNDESIHFKPALEDASKGKSSSRNWRADSYIPGDARMSDAISRMFQKLGTQIRSSSQNLGMNESNHDHHGPVQLAKRGKLTEADEVLLDGSEQDYDAFDNQSERTQKKLYSPNHRFHRWHATFMLIVLLLFVFYMPFRIAFYPRDSGAWSCADVTWNVMFFVDIIIRLNTGFVDRVTGMVVYDRRRIFRTYVKGWLIVDILAAFPFTFMPGWRPEDAEGNHEMAYLFSVPKLLELYGLLTVAQENHRIHDGAFLAARTLLSVIVTAHLFGCGWYMLSALTHKECEDIYYDGGDEDFFVNGHKYNSMEYVDSECPWIYRNDYVNLSVGRQYLGSVYWALTTLTTVGYGDISARTADEQVYSMTVQIVGVSWYGYIVGTWASVLNSFDSEDKEQRSKMREVVAFSKAANLPPEIAKKVRQHFRFALYRKDNWITFNEQELVADMPATLRGDVVSHVQRHTISQIPWLQGKDPSFVADVVLQLKPYIFHDSEELYKEGRPAEEMFFITSGRVSMRYKDTGVGVLKEGQMAGLVGLFSLENHKLTAVAIEEVKCLSLVKSQFMVLMESYPNIMQELLQIAKSLSRKIGNMSAEARADMMNNQVLSELLVPMTKSPEYAESPHRYRLESAFESDRLTHLSIGHTEERDNTRMRLPSSWEPAPQGTAAINAAVRNLNLTSSPRPLHSSAPNSAASSAVNAVIKTLNSNSDADDSSTADSVAGNNPGTASTATTFANSGSGGASGTPDPLASAGYHSSGLGSFTGSMASVVGAGFEDAVSREVGLRLSGIEARLTQTIERTIAKAAMAMAVATTPQASETCAVGPGGGSAEQDEVN